MTADHVFSFVLGIAFHLVASGLWGLWRYQQLAPEREVVLALGPAVKPLRAIDGGKRNG